MIQRIQTLFLLAAAALLTSMLFLPLAEIRTDAGELYTGWVRGLQDQNGGLLVATWPLFILVLVTAVLLLLNIFLYRRRKLQIRICVYAIILGFGLVGLLYYFWVVIFRQLDVDSYWFRISVVFPVLAIILTYLAFRGIRKDDFLIRSIDRIR
jgi:drug/metabolite transporter (DMT)-like permease